MVYWCFILYLLLQQEDHFMVSSSAVNRLWLTDFLTGSKHSVGLPVSNSRHWVNCAHVQISWPHAKMDFASHSVVSPSSRISVVWKHFGFEKDDRGKLVKGAWATCKLCMQKVAHGSGTTNLKNHVRTKHRSTLVLPRYKNIYVICHGPLSHDISHVMISYKGKIAV